MVRPGLPDRGCPGSAPSSVPPALTEIANMLTALSGQTENLGYAAAVDGYRLVVDELPITPRRTAEITVRFGSGSKPGDNAASFLAGAKHRRTNRGPYRSSFPAGATEELRAIPCEPATSLTLIEDMAGRLAAAELAARAMRVLFSVPELRRDLAPFVFTSADEPPKTGMPIESLNPAMTAKVPGSQWVLEMASADEEAGAARARFEHAPLHFAVSSRTDTLPGWIAGGRTATRARDGYCARSQSLPGRRPVRDPHLVAGPASAGRPR